MAIHQISVLPLIFFLLFFTPTFTYGNNPTEPVTMQYHNGPVMNGSLNLVLIWYGSCGRIQKNVIRNFIKSLNPSGPANLQPKVSTWWSKVESYQSAVPGAPAGPPPPITVEVVKQITDTSYKYGKILTSIDIIPKMAKDATNGDPHLLPVIITARDVTVQGLCTGKCAEHGVYENNKPYIVVGNPETECPGACLWPFHEPDVGPKGVILQPPSENPAADAMVIAFAVALADTVASPEMSGFFGGLDVMNPIGPGTACHVNFGSGAVPGNPGNVLTDPATGRAFNAHGNNSKKFLLPGIWDLSTNSCWTLM